MAGPFWISSGFCSRPWGRAGMSRSSLCHRPLAVPGPGCSVAASNPQQLCFNTEKKKKPKNKIKIEGALEQLPGETLMEEGDAKSGLASPWDSLPCSAALVVLLWDGAGTSRHSPGGPGAPIAVCQRLSPAWGCCESRPPLLAPQPARERAVSDVHEEKN